jgi:hypothetical protein
MQTRNLASMIHAQVEKYSDKKNALYYKEGNESWYFKVIVFSIYGNEND